MIASRTSHLPRVHQILGDQRAKIFRNDFDRRNFVSSGAAAGVAAAFGAPIGGVLFSLEEASSFWSLPLTWGVFFTAMISTFTVNILMSAHKGDIDAVNDPGLITFGSFVVQPYRLFEIPIFALIAVCGGLLGALFNFLNIKVNRWRKEFFKLGRTFDSELKVKLARCAESIFVAWFTATMFYWIPYAMRDSCREESEATDACGAIFEQTYENYLCENKTEYNSMATLMLQPQEEVIEALFHDYTPAGEFAFRPGDLVVYFMLYFFISAYTFGISVPAGLFVPAILCGSSFGRLVGEAVQHWADDDSIRPGTYALIGATAMLGGT
jgi:chloride channel 7